MKLDEAGGPGPRSQLGREDPAAPSLPSLALDKAVLEASGGEQDQGASSCARLHLTLSLLSRKVCVWLLPLE